MPAPTLRTLLRRYQAGSIVPLNLPNAFVSAYLTLPPNDQLNSVNFLNVSQTNQLMNHLNGSFSTEATEIEPVSFDTDDNGDDEYKEVEIHG